MAVRKLRETLGDDAENPLYIETIPKRGYRLLVTDVQPASVKGETARPPLPAIATLASSPAQLAKEAAQPRVVSGGLKKGLFAIAILIVLAATVTFRLLPHRGTKLSGSETLALADFAN